MTLHAVANPLIRIDRDRTLFHQNLIGVNAVCDFTHHGLDVREISSAGIALGGSDRDEYNLALFDGRAEFVTKCTL